MIVKMLTSMSGPDGVRNRGDEVDLPADEAARLIEAGFAEPVRSEPREKAVKKPAAEKTRK